MMVVISLRMIVLVMSILCCDVGFSSYSYHDDIKILTDIVGVRAAGDGVVIW